MNRCLYICWMICMGCGPAADTPAMPAVEIKDTLVKPVSKAAPGFTFDPTLIPVKYKQQRIRLERDSFYLTLPVGFNIVPAAQGLKRLRFLAMSPDGRLFATDMFDRSDNHKGRVLIFSGWDEATHTYGRVSAYLSNLHNPNQVAFYNNYIYVAETDKLSRYVYVPGDTIPRTGGETIATFPDYGLGYKYGGWHLTRSLAFSAGKLYVSVGSSCNACIEHEPVRASILQMNPDGSQQLIFASGLRNSVGIGFIGNSLWATGMGRDLIGPDKPEDLFQEIKQGVNYGWPYYFQYRGQVLADPEFKDSIKPAGLQKPPVAYCGFKAHSAPLGFEYFSGFADPVLKNGVLVCLHGSTSVWRQRGNSIVKAGKGKYMDIISGFLEGTTEAGRHGRPCDILMKDSRSFFFTDDLNGVLYYVWN